MKAIKYAFVFLYLVISACTHNKTNQTTETKPNFLFILADDQRYNTIHRLGNDEIITPNLDVLSETGVYFSNAHIMGAMNGAVCAPSRAMLMTGRTVFHIIPSGEDIEEVHITLPELLTQNGYRTFHTGKWHNGKKAFARSFSEGDNIFFGGMSDHYKVPLHHFDSAGVYPNKDIYNLEDHSVDIYAESAVNYLQNYKSDDPFFMYVAFQSPHDPKQVPDEFIKMYDPSKLTLPPNFLPQHPFDNGELNIRDEWLTKSPRNPEDVKAHLAAYYGMISHVDHAVGKILKALEESGKAENTYIIFSADNGLAVGQHGLMGKQNLYEHSIKVPLIISGPVLPKDKESKALTYLIDVYPTICDLANVQKPSTIEGYSLLPVLQNESESVREDGIFAYKNAQRAIKSNDWKLIVYNVNGVHQTQLFNLKEDQWEINNLADLPENKPKVDSLMLMLNKGLRMAGDSVDVYKQGWGVKSYPTWEETANKNPENMNRLRKLADDENEMVKGYWKKK